LVTDEKLCLQTLEAENIRLRAEIAQQNKSAEVLEAFFSHTVSAVVILDRNYNFVRVNKVCAQASSRDVSDFPGHNLFEFFPSEAIEIFDQVVQAKAVYQVAALPFTFSAQSERGVTYWDWTLAPVLDDSGEVELLICTIIEVTEQVRMQGKLAASKEYYRAIFNNCLVGILLTASDGTIKAANLAACRMFGRSEEELRAVGRQGILDLNDPRVGQALKHRAKAGSCTNELTLLRRDGTKFIGEVTSNLFEDRPGQILTTMIIHDITERKRTEAALRLSEAKFSKAFYCNQIMMAIRRLKDGVFIDVNNSYAAVLGYRREEMIGKNVAELDIWADPQKRGEMEQELLKKGYIKNHEYVLKNRSGETGCVAATVNLIDIDGDQCLLVSSIDITGHKQTQISKELFFTLFGSNPLPMYITSIKDERFIEANQAVFDFSGYTREELLGVRITELNKWEDPAEYIKFSQAILEAGFVKNFETSLLKKLGQKITALVSGVPITWNGEECLLVIVNDITDLRRYQQEIERLNQLNLIGEMSAGMGHEIRNPMTVIKGLLQLLRTKDRYAQDKECLDLMIEELDRVNAIITEFLLLDKDKAVEKKRQSLNQKIRAILPMLQAEALEKEKRIALELGDIPYLTIDQNEIKQLLLNLAQNGLEAMHPGGLLSIKTYQDDGGVVLAVQDQGTGMTLEVLEKVGTPFFTTKDSGIGLGLAMCYSIAQRHKARIDITTGPTGTTFYVRFKVKSAQHYPG